MSIDTRNSSDEHDYHFGFGIVSGHVHFVLLLYLVWPAFVLKIFYFIDIDRRCRSDSENITESNVGINCEKPNSIGYSLSEIVLHVTGDKCCSVCWTVGT